MKKAAIVFAVIVVWAVGYAVKYFIGIDEGFLYSAGATFVLGFLWK